MTKREHFASVMQALAEAFERTLTPLMLEGYWMALEPLSTAQLAAAAKHAIAACRFMPRPVELLDFAGVPKADPKADALICWQAVRQAIDKHDWTVRSIDFGPRVNAVVRNIGGWDMLCKASLPELDNPGWLRKRFCEVYETFATVDPNSLRGEALEGRLPPQWNCPLDVLVAIPGQPKPLALPAVDPTVAKHIEELAEAKS